MDDFDVVVMLLHSRITAKIQHCADPNLAVLRPLHALPPPAPVAVAVAAAAVAAAAATAANEGMEDEAPKRAVPNQRINKTSIFHLARARPHSRSAPTPLIHPSEFKSRRSQSFKP